jgi:hypothetical protein
MSLDEVYLNNVLKILRKREINVVKVCRIIDDWVYFWGKFSEDNEFPLRARVGRDKHGIFLDLKKVDLQVMFKLCGDAA